MKKFILGVLFGSIGTVVSGFVGSLALFGWLLEKHPKVADSISDWIVDLLSYGFERTVYGAEKKPTNVDYTRPMQYQPYSRVRSRRHGPSMPMPEPTIGPDGD